MLYELVAVRALELSELGYLVLLLLLCRKIHGKLMRKLMPEAAQYRYRASLSFLQAVYDNPLERHRPD